MFFPQKIHRLGKTMNPASVNRTNGEYNVCFQGSSLDIGNLGGCALTASFIKLVTDIKPNARLNLLYANRTNGVQSLKVSGKTVHADIVNCRLSPKSRISEHLFWILLLALIQRIIPIRSVGDVIIRSNRWLRTLDKADFVGEIRGGDSFSDIYGLRRFILGIIPCFVAILMRKKLVLLPQTYGPFKSRATKAIARFILLRSHRIFARDRESIELVQRLLRRQSKDKIIGFCPDIAFTLEAALPEEPNIQPKLDQKNSAPLIGLNISGLLYLGGYTRDNMFELNVDYKHFVPVLLEELMKRTNAHVLLIPHVYWGNVEGDELQICRELFESIDEKYADRIHLFNQEYDQSQTKGIIGLCDFFIGSRMHACIAALSQGIPVVGLAYSKKFYGVFETIGAEKFVIDMCQRSHEEIVEIVISAFEQRNIIAENLKTAIPKAQKQIRNVFKEILCEAQS
jgi:colanic acid/amylovoran biosynthesis protein